LGFSDSVKNCKIAKIHHPPQAPPAWFEPEKIAKIAKISGSSIENNSQ